MTVALTPDLVETFAGVFLSGMYDEPVATPPFHRECWALYCSDQLLAAVAAPRFHAKSTALTHAYILANVCFRVESHVMLVGSSEELAMTGLVDMAKELRENDDLRAEFGIKKFITDAKGEIVVECDDGYQFRILARGVEQRVRGIKWNGRRPGLIVGDDMEEDEQVENATRRRKLNRWVNRALIPMGRRGCKVRFHGTIIHQDSLLANFIRASKKPNGVWKALFYAAHASFDDFSNILWPEHFTEVELRAIRQRFIDDLDAGGYSQEMLNDPQDNEDAYLRKEWFRPMREEDFEALDSEQMLIGVGVDFAISVATAANRTSFTVGGKDVSNLLHIVDERVGRMDSEEIIDEFFSIQERWNPSFFWVESGQIWLSLKATIYKEMIKADIFFNIVERTPIKDKAARGRPYQKRMKAGAMRFDKEASWYAGYEEENLHFTGVTEAKLDDQFDSTATLVLGFEELPEVDDEDFVTPDEEDFKRADPRLHLGRSSVTGY